MRHIGRDLRVTARGRHALLRDRRRVVAVDQVVRDARMVGMLLELLLEDRPGLEVGGIGLVGLQLRPRDVQGGEDLRLVVVRILRRERLVGLGARDLARALRPSGEVVVVGGHRFEVVALALGLRSHFPALVDGALSPRPVLGGGALAGERIRHQDRGVAPGGDGAGVVLRGHLLERLLRRRVVERVQHSDAAQQFLLHRGAARVLEFHLADLSGGFAGRLDTGRRGEREGNHCCRANDEFHHGCSPLMDGGILRRSRLDR